MAHKRQNPYVSAPAKSHRLPTQVAYIDCPTNCWRSNPDVVREAIEDVLDIGATIINIVFNNDKIARSWRDDISAIPGLANFHFCFGGAVMCWFLRGALELYQWREVVHEYGSPSQVLIFTELPRIPEPHGFRWTIVTASLPVLYAPIRNRVLEAIHEEATHSNSHAVLIGGRFNCSMLCVENQAGKHDSRYIVSANQDLCVVSSCPKDCAIESNPLEGCKDGPYTLLFELVRTTDEPAPKRVRLNPSSAARPGAPASCSSSAAKPIRCIRIKLSTPLYDKLLAWLEEQEAHALIEHIEKFCFFDSLCEGASVSSKMEDLLQVVLAKRTEIAHKARLWKDGYTEIDHDKLQDYTATDDECKALMNDWRNDVASWMLPANLATYYALKNRQEAHQFARKRFVTYCFQISGCRFLLQKLIQLPIVHFSDSSGASAITRLVLDLKEHKNTDQYKENVAEAKQRRERDKRINNDIWWAKFKLERGRYLSTFINDRGGKRIDLQSHEKQLLEEFERKRPELEQTLAFVRKRASSTPEV